MLAQRVQASYHGTASARSDLGYTARHRAERVHHTRSAGVLSAQEAVSCKKAMCECGTSTERGNPVGDGCVLDATDSAPSRPKTTRLDSVLEPLLVVGSDIIGAACQVRNDERERERVQQANWDLLLTRDAGFAWVFAD